MKRIKKSLIIGLCFVFGTTFSQQKIWTLQKCVAHALEYNITVKRGENALLINSQDIKAAKGQFLPSVSASASHSTSVGVQRVDIGQSQVFVGRCYINGWGVEEDEKTAVEWFTKSAEPYEAQMESSGETWMVDQRNQFLVTGRLSLNGLTSLSDVAAECLGKHAGEDDNLYLNGLTTLSDAAIDSLTSIWNLGFDGFTNLPDTAAKSLSKHVGNLYLNGLTNLSDVAEENLSKHKGTLSLNGLRELSDFAAERFGEHEGQLDLDSLTSLSDAAAESLSKHKGSLSLRGLTSLSDAAAESFSKYEEWLTMGLTNVSDAVAESLRMHTGFLSLNGLTTLSDAAAESLRKHEGDLSFGRLVNISDVAAESLAKCYCERCDLNLSMLPASASLILSGPKKKILTLKIAKQSSFFVPFTWIEDDAAQYLANSGKNKLIINDLQLLTDASAAALSEYPGDLRLLGLKDISDTAAQHLAKHSCLTLTLDNLPTSAAQILRDAGKGV